MARSNWSVNLILNSGPLNFGIILDDQFQTQANILAVLRAGSLYESVTSQILLRLLRPGEGFIDVGSHVGYYALLARAAAGPEAPIFAFEPNAETYGGLILNVLSNRATNIHTFNCALGDKAETLTFYLNDDNEGESALWDPAANARFPITAHRRRTQSVAAMPLDLLAATGAFDKVQMVKIDAEGWEFKVLAGAAGFIKSQRPRHIICEINRDALEACGTHVMAIRHFLTRLGYHCFLIRDSILPSEIWDGRALRLLAESEVGPLDIVHNLLFSLHDRDL